MLSIDMGVETTERSEGMSTAISDKAPQKEICVLGMHLA